MLLATTNQMCQEVASVPFLWILPLSLYLISFIVCFAVPYVFMRPLFLPLTIFSLFVGAYLILAGVKVPLPLQVGGYATILFACCMSCHGELANIKPHTSYLTLFYLMVSIGGALGGVFVVIIAPNIFIDYLEFHYSLVACAFFSSVVFILGSFVRFCSRDFSSKESVGPLTMFMGLGLLLSWLLTVVFLIVGTKSVYWAHQKANEIEKREKILHKSRNAYGTLTASSWYTKDLKNEYARYLYNGRIKHGNQFFNRKRELERSIGWSRSAISYYGPDSGIAHSFKSLRTLIEEGDSLKVAVIGLGTGTVAAWGRPNDQITFYEINPEVEKVARKYFFYLEESDAKIDVVTGDARIQLEREWEEKGSNKYDIIAVDAFTSDAIPIHLLTKECFEIYDKHLSERGILAIHISNRYLELSPIVYNLAKDGGFRSYHVSNDDDDREMIDAASWVLVTKNKYAFPLLEDVADDWNYIKENYWEPEMKDILWTDDFASLTSIIDWEKSKEYLKGDGKSFFKEEFKKFRRALFGSGEEIEDDKKKENEDGEEGGGEGEDEGGKVEFDF